MDSYFKKKKTKFFKINFSFIRRLKYKFKMGSELEQFKGIYSLVLTNEDFLDQLRKNHELLCDEYKLVQSLGYPALSEIEQTIIPVRKYLEKANKPNFMKNMLVFEIFEEEKIVRKKILKIKRVKNTISTITTQLLQFQDKQRRIDRIKLLKGVTDSAHINDSVSPNRNKKYGSLQPDSISVQNMESLHNRTNNFQLVDLAKGKSLTDTEQQENLSTAQYQCSIDA